MHRLYSLVLAMLLVSVMLPVDLPGLTSGAPNPPGHHDDGHQDDEPQRP